MRALAVVLVALLLATPLSSQNWTGEEQSVIDHVRNCWDAWVEAAAEETPNRWATACPVDENAYWWWSPDGVPNNVEEWVYRNWDLVREAEDKWIGLRPVRVNVFGDVGIIHFYGYWRSKTPDGVVTYEQKRTEVFQRRDGQWVLIGAQSTPASGG